jgi:hypothetical protein
MPMGMHYDAREIDHSDGRRSQVRMPGRVVEIVLDA